MTKKHLAPFVFYDGRADIALPEMERLVQGLVWMGDVVLLPSYVRPSPFVPEHERELVSLQLSRLAEAGYVKRWGVETLPQRFVETWRWPRGTGELVLPGGEYSDVQQLVNEGVARQKSDLLRGYGQKPGSLVSGVAELVSLRETLWTLAVARYFSAEILLSSSRRTASLSSPLKLLKHAEVVSGPITETLLEMNGISGLALLSPQDIRRLRRKSAGVRAFVDAVSREAELKEPFIDTDHADELLKQVTIRQYAQLAGDVVRQDQRVSARSAIGGTSLTFAGVVFPPLAVAGFAAPVLEWNPTGRQRRQVLVFLNKLRRTTAKRNK